MLRHEPQVHRQRVLQASHHQHRTDHQHYRERDLPRHDEIARAPAAEAIGHAALDAADQIRACRLDGGRQSEQERRQQSGCRRESQHQTVRPQTGFQRDVNTQMPGTEQPACAEGNAKAERASNGGQQ